jgi:hypothetical protein
MPRPELAFVIAGGDVLAGDRFGQLGLSLDGARERDLLVASELEGVPSVWLPGGGYTRKAWKVLAGTGMALAAGSLEPIPEDYDPLSARIARVSGQLSPSDLGDAGELTAEDLEEALGLRPGALRFEVQVETPQSVIGPDGTALVARMVHVAGPRLTGLHYGTYDYSASCGIAAGQQSLEHPVADHAKLVMQAAAAGTGVRLSDGSTNILPVGGADAVAHGWATHHRLVRRSLERGFPQGWDLHPAQLPTRYAATYSFYREGLPGALARLVDYRARTMATIADEPATARALATYLLRGLDCGAVEEREVEAGAGLGRADLRALAHHRPQEV